MRSTVAEVWFFHKVLLKQCEDIKGIVGVLTRRSGPNSDDAACFSSQMLMQEAAQLRTGLSWFRPWGRTSCKRVCGSTVLSCTRGASSRGYKRGERGREAPRSLLEEELIEADANIGAQKSICAV